MIWSILAVIGGVLCLLMAACSIIGAVVPRMYNSVNDPSSSSLFVSAGVLAVVGAVLLVLA